MKKKIETQEYSGQNVRSRNNFFNLPPHHWEEKLDNLGWKYSESN